MKIDFNLVEQAIKTSGVGMPTSEIKAINEYFNDIDYDDADVMIKAIDSGEQSLSRAEAKTLARIRNDSTHGQDIESRNTIEDWDWGVPVSSMLDSVKQDEYKQHEVDVHNYDEQDLSRQRKRMQDEWDKSGSSIYVKDMLK
jgi:hypothetical protein